MTDIFPNPNNAIITAVLIDGSFFLKRYPKVFRNRNNHSPEIIVENLELMVKRHVTHDYLYRALFYDCKPFVGKTHHIITGQHIDFAQTDLAIKRRAIFKEIATRRKFALRLGDVKPSYAWVINSRYTKDLIRGNIDVSALTENDVKYEMRQKGVDIKIGIDIASLALKRLVNKIILVAGDSDFVPAAKLARRNGIDIVLDPMWNHIAEDLNEHIDGLKSTCPNPERPFDPQNYKYRIQ